MYGKRRSRKSPKEPWYLKAGRGVVGKIGGKEGLYEVTEWADQVGWQSNPLSSM